MTLPGPRGMRRKGCRLKGPATPRAFPDRGDFSEKKEINHAIFMYYGKSVYTRKGALGNALVPSGSLKFILKNS